MADYAAFFSDVLIDALVDATRRVHDAESRLPEAFAAARRAEGHRAFKLKTGFGHALDVRNLTAMREAIGPDDELSCDANQVSASSAARFSPVAASKALYAGTKSAPRFW